MNLQHALDDPSSCFESPAAVLRSGEISREQKIQILHRWEYDARLLEVAQEENMMGAGTSVLSDVLDALHALGETGSSIAPTKQGGTSFGRKTNPSN